MALSDIRRSGKVIVGQNDKKFIHVHVYEGKRASKFAFAKKIYHYNGSYNFSKV